MMDGVGIKKKKTHFNLAPLGRLRGIYTVAAEETPFDVMMHRITKIEYF
jgi:hypothetical protein